MAYRFTDTDKWKDAWFTNLSQIEMLLFLYLCDNCNIAGIIEVNYRLWAFELRSTESTIKGALKGLERSVLISDCGEYVFLKNFIKHQKNLPLNEENKAHLGIIRRLAEILPKFIGDSQPVDIKVISSFVQSPYKGAAKPLQRGTGIGIGNGMGNKEGDSLKEGEEPLMAEIYSFDDFWNDYGKKVGKEKSERLWGRISDTDKLLIKDYIPKYKDAQPDKTYRKNPETFLRNKGWEDEIIKSSNYGIQKDRHDRVHEVVTDPATGDFSDDI